MSRTLVRRSIRLPPKPGVGSPYRVLSCSRFLSSSAAGDKEGKTDNKKPNVNILKSLEDDVSKSRFEVDELKRVAETTLSEQKQLLTQKWDEVKSGWKNDNKSSVVGVSEETTQEW